MRARYVAAVCGLVGLLGLVGCGGGSGGSGPIATAATPTFSVAAGSYTSAQTVAISSTTPGATIYYTTNGTAPTTSSMLYGGAITVSGSETVEAIAVESGYTNSTVASAAYVINLRVGLTGLVYSGQQPIVGAHVYLFAAGTTGYGGAGIAASSSNMSVSLLSAAETGASDAVGAYVVTGSNGGFSLTGDFTCASGQQLYLYALGGNAGAGANSAAGLTAVLGSCSSASGPAVFATVNEVTTIAAAYAMAAFATDATHVGSSGTALAQTGIANAFANAGNLVTLSTGVALAMTPAGNGTVPQSEINTLANILVGCVDSAGPSSANCSTLLANAASGGTTPITPTDTATAAVNIAHNPGTNIANLYALAASPAPFTPVLTTQPNDFTIAISFTGSGLVYPTGIAIDGSGNAWIPNGGNGGGSFSKFSALGVALSPSTGYTGGGLSYPLGIAIDGSGDAWTANETGSTITELSNLGIAVSPPAGYSGGGLDVPMAVAIDGSGNAWITNDAANDHNFSVSKFSNLGAAISPSTGYTGGGLDSHSGIAIDGSGNAWIANGNGGTLNTSNCVTKLSASGAAVSPSTGYTGGGIDYPTGIAIDNSGNVWATNDGNNSVAELSNLGVALSPSTGYTGGGLNYPVGIAADGAGNVWIANLGSGGITELSDLGVAVSPSTGYTRSSLAYPGEIAIDGSGDAWVTQALPTGAFEFIGVAAPVITPIAAGLPATPTANGSSNLGTRP
jgi:hypothetical protein